ncbi:hypothetical protein R2362_03255 [Mycobacteroides chelonae]|nr:hypothetical protein [Mycobacteroides chelonae]
MNDIKLPELPDGYWWRLDAENDHRGAYLAIWGPVKKTTNSVIAAVSIDFRHQAMHELAHQIASEAESLVRRREVYLDAATLLGLADGDY